MTDSSSATGAATGERPIEDLLGEVWWRRKPRKVRWDQLPESEMKRANRRLGTKMWVQKLMSTGDLPPQSPPLSNEREG